jgi:tetratricopeptide (TPR) repeat protein
MDPALSAAARALAAGDPLGALRHVALRDDAPALALRGTAMAQLGDHGRARQLLARAARAFGPGDRRARARCVTAEAEVALASRDLVFPTRALGAAIAALEAQGDRRNALHARLVAARWLLLVGQLDRAEGAIDALDRRDADEALAAVAELATAEIARRRLASGRAREALTRARDAARRSGIPALAGEVLAALRALDAPAARLLASGEERLLRLDDVEGLLASGELVVDACRRAVRQGSVTIALERRPVLLALARALAEAAPGDVARDALARRVFGPASVAGSQRARLRVEIGRLRRALAPLADVRATARGFSIAPRAGARVVVLAPPIDGDDAAVLALLADGERWSTSALALALGASQRTVQRALSDLEAGRRPAHARVEPFRHRRDLGRRGLVARHVGRRHQ